MAAGGPLRQASRDPVSQKTATEEDTKHQLPATTPRYTHAHTHNVEHIKKCKHTHATIINKNKGLN